MTDFDYDQFVEVHEPQLRTTAVPEVFWPALFQKLKNEEFDAGKYFQVIIEEQEDGQRGYSVIALEEIKADGPENIFLIDHAWTFRPNTARTALKEVPGFKERLMDAFGIKPEDFEDTNSCSDYIGSDSGDAHPSARLEADVTERAEAAERCSLKSAEDGAEARCLDAILDRLWQFAHTYTIRRAQAVLDEQDLPVWYLPDEFGIRVGHDPQPNVRMAPFFDGFRGQAFSLLFPVRDIKEEEEVTRNYVENAVLHQHPDWYNVLLHPWHPVDLSETDVPRALKDDKFFLSGRQPDSLPQEAQRGPARDPLGVLDTVRVFATERQLPDRLHEVQWEAAERPAEADVLWLREHHHDFADLALAAPHALVNQFPFEANLTVKDLFAAAVEAAPGFAEGQPAWFQTSYNLNEELPAFVAHFQRREKRNLDNTWIVKPWNLARGLDTFVTKNLNAIIRAVETGPKLVCKYVEDPVLFRRPDTGALVKFDLRYIVFARCLEPLELLVYKDFWPRCAVNEYDLTDLSDNFAHLSVHNYTDKSKVLNIRAPDFIDQLSKLSPQIDWSATQARIDQVIREVFQTVLRQPPPRGMAPNLQSRAMYGFDIMLKWKDASHESVEVTFLEANFLPDCERACDFYADFADTAFQTLFLGGGSNRVRHI